MLMRVQIIKEDRGWKGTCGRIGEEYIVFSRPRPAPYGEGQHVVFGKSVIALYRDDFKRVPLGLKGLAMIARALPLAYRDWRMARSITRALNSAHD